MKFLLASLPVMVGIFLCTSINSAYANNLITNRTIVAVLSGWEGEGVYVDVQEPVTQQQLGYACATSRYFMPTTSPMFRENLALITTAFASNSKIDLVAIDCQLGTIRFKAVQLRK